jgi:diguanylate cyclase (GGDEF)-like protein/PAS domain S-box-containing protein
VTPDEGAGELPPGAFRHIVDTTGNPFVVIGADGDVRYASATVVDVLGWAAADLVGRNIVELLPPDQVAVAIEGVSEVDTVNRTADGVPMVFEVLRPDGSRNPVEVAALPVVDLAGDDIIALRVRPFESQHHFDGFLAAMLDGRPLDELLEPLCRSIAVSLGAAGVAVHHGHDGSRFASSPSWGLPEGLVADASWVPVDEPASFPVASLPEAVRAVVAASAAGSSSVALSEVWTVPVPSMDGLPPAVLSVWRRPPGAPLVGHRSVLGRSVRYVQLALVRTAEHQRLGHLARHDSLTGVANRGEFRDRLARALAAGERDLAVAFCDLDGFKPVNDTFGHPAGDAVLVQVADRLRRLLRSGDELARLGGDEFTVLLRNVADADAAALVGERLLTAVHEPFLVPAREGVADVAAAGEPVVVPVSVGLSIGIALSSSGATADGLLAAADAALYDAKRSGRGAARVAAPD